MLAVYLVIALALLVYVGTFIYCGYQRGRCKVEAPSMDGPVEFQCAVRIQQNTLEQLVPFVPACLIFAETIGTGAAAALGGAWVIGRVIYAVSYARSPKSRGPGFLIAFFSLMSLILGDVVAAIAGLVIGGHS